MRSVVDCVVLNHRKVSMHRLFDSSIGAMWALMRSPWLTNSHTQVSISSRCAAGRSASVYVTRLRYESRSASRLMGDSIQVRIPLPMKYFMGNGILTWMLSPINLLADLLSYRNRVTYTLADLPAAHREEIETCVCEFVNHGDRIKAHIAPMLESNKRCMLTFRWFNTTQSTTLRIPAFERNYRFIKTIAVSVFKTHERTSWHFGPLRLTLRVLYNLEPVHSPDVFIEVDDRVHRWMDDPLFIFDDTAFHCSINGV